MLLHMPMIFWFHSCVKRRKHKKTILAIEPVGYGIGFLFRPYLFGESTNPMRGKSVHAQTWSATHTRNTNRGVVNRGLMYTGMHEV